MSEEFNGGQQRSTEISSMRYPVHSLHRSEDSVQFICAFGPDDSLRLPHIISEGYVTFNLKTFLYTSTISTSQQMKAIMKAEDISLKLRVVNLKVNFSLAFLICSQFRRSKQILRTRAHTHTHTNTN